MASGSDVITTGMTATSAHSEPRSNLPAGVNDHMDYYTFELIRIRAKNCSHDVLCQEIFAQDTLLDIEYLEGVGIGELLESANGVMNSLSGKRSMNAMLQTWQVLKKEPSEDQRLLREVCKQMNFYNKTTAIGREPKGPHAVVEREVADEMNQILAEMPDIKPEHIIVSPQYEELVDRLFAKRLEGRRQPKAERLDPVPLPIMSRFARDMIKNCMPGNVVQNKLDLFTSADGFYDEVEVRSFVSRQTRSTGDGPRGDQGQRSFGSWAKKKAFKLPAEDVDVRSEASFLSAFTSFSQQHILWRDFSDVLNNEFDVDVPGEVLASVFGRCLARVDAASSQAGVLGIPDLVGSMKLDTEMDLQSRQICKWKCPVIKSRDEFIDEMLTRMKRFVSEELSIEPTILEKKVVGGVIPAEAIDECADDLLQQVRKCLHKDILSGFFIPAAMEARGATKSNVGLFKAMKNASKYFVESLAVEMDKFVVKVPTPFSPVFPRDLCEFVLDQLRNALSGTTVLLQKAWDRHEKERAHAKNQQRAQSVTGTRSSQGPGFNGRTHRTLVERSGECEPHGWSPFDSF